MEIGKARDHSPNPANMRYGWSDGATNTPKIPNASLTINSDRRSQPPKITIASTKKIKQPSPYFLFFQYPTSRLQCITAKIRI
ncbi:MAG: hypothetical protein ACOYN8_18745 [Pseudanabaena sp.]